MSTVEPSLTIGEFSKMTYLTVKALRHYHDVGLLVPATVDASSGYRRYSVGQIATAQAIRRFRDLDMPIDEVRQVLDAPDEASRNQAILRHLERMQQQLEQTQATVASLQALLTYGEPALGPVDITRLPSALVRAVTAEVTFEECASWLEPALAGLHASLEREGIEASGPDGALYPDELFSEGVGGVTAFVPVAAAGDHVLELPATTVAVLRYDGPFGDLDQAYGALGTIVTERGIGGPGPIREHYLDDTTTDVCWPVISASR